jgi:hypothetical protein
VTPFRSCYQFFSLDNALGGVQIQIWTDTLRPKHKCHSTTVKRPIEEIGILILDHLNRPLHELFICARLYCRGSSAGCFVGSAAKCFTYPCTNNGCSPGAHRLNVRELEGLAIFALCDGYTEIIYCILRLKMRYKLD